MKKIIITVLLIIYFVTACSPRSSHEKNTTVLTVKRQAASTTLYYAGTVQPLKSMIVASPTEGSIEEMKFQLGETIKKGQLLFVINSDKFRTDYTTALTAYIKAKNQFANDQDQLNSSQFLHNNKLISDDELKGKKTTFYSSQLALLQAKETLAQLLTQMHITDKSIYALSIADINKVTNTLQLQGNAGHLQIISDYAGLALMPQKGGDSAGAGGGDASKKIQKGDKVKQGDVLVAVGDLTGLTVNISVNEFNINQLKLGQKVKVTGIAFPKFILLGKVVSIDHQAQTGQGGMPMFAVQCVVEHLTPEQQAVIHVGMSAKVEAALEEPAAIMIPINAVTMKNGMSMVNLVDEKTQQPHLVPIKTGETTQDSVAVLSGLNEGDKIIVSH